MIQEKTRKESLVTSKAGFSSQEKEALDLFRTHNDLDYHQVAKKMKIQRTSSSRLLNGLYRQSKIIATGTRMTKRGEASRKVTTYSLNTTGQKNPIRDKKKKDNEHEKMREEIAALKLKVKKFEELNKTENQRVLIMQSQKNRAVLEQRNLELKVKQLQKDNEALNKDNQDLRQANDILQAQVG